MKLRGDGNENYIVEDKKRIEENKEKLK